ncbi:hypothetical protein L911_1492 [Vibrio fluvialis I21563]|nr:hypothetical protein L911_1492 [Vibrio fluvialis I21563]
MKKLHDIFCNLGFMMKIKLCRMRAKEVTKTFALGHCVVFS